MTREDRRAEERGKILSKTREVRELRREGRGKLRGDGRQGYR